VKTFLSSDEIIASAEEKAWLAPFADAVDMESFSVLEAARKLPGVAIRVVSDRFDQDMPMDFSAAADGKGNVLIASVLKHVVMHPIQIPALIRLGRESRTAAQKLANFLAAYIKEISFTTDGSQEAFADLAAGHVN
jgi:adenosylhomocysteine nucleosidase